MSPSNENAAPVPVSATGYGKRLNALRVLVVEDHHDSAQTLGALIKAWGHECCVCTTGAEALALVPSFKPNVVLLDIDLPDMKGWELAGRLPSGPLLIAITGRSATADFQRSKIAGIHYHLVKPEFQSQLRGLLDRLL